MKEGLIFTVRPEESGMRLDRFLRTRLPGSTTRCIRFAIEAGEVRVGGGKGRKGRFVTQGENVAVGRIFEEKDWIPAPAEVPGAATLLDDGVVAALDKPPGVHTEPQRPGEEATLAGHLLHLHPGVAAMAPGPSLTLLTRLDYDTSGAVLCALTPEAFAFLKGERERGRIRKTYCCLVEGALDKEMTIAYRLKTEGGETVRIRTDQREEDPLRWTAVAPIRRMGDRTLVRAVISRGRRHQIRAHLAAAGHPLVGDHRYGGVSGKEGQGGRLMLHANEVEFVHPARGETVRVASPLPASFGFTVGS